MKEEMDAPKEDANDFSDFSFAVEADLYSLDDIFAKAKDQFGTAQDLQYYHMHDREWRSLTNHEELDAFQTYCFAWVLRLITEDQPCPLVVPIHIPQFFQDEEDDELGPEGETGVQTPHVHNLEGMIEYLLYQLMQSEWQRVPVKDMDVTKTTVWRLQRALRPDEVGPLRTDDVAPEMTTSTTTAETSHDPAASEATSTPTNDVASEMTLSTTAETSKDLAASSESTLMEEEAAPKEAEEKPQFYYMDTRDWILQQAARDVKLRGLLMYYLHSLEHITECLHYSFLWDNFPRLKDGTPHPDGVSAVEDELPPGVERIVTTNDVATNVSPSSASNMSA